MNCSYRILKDVHIGVRVRKTKDKKTVPFKNDPMTGVRIVRWSDQGFELSHPDLPKNIWVDFYQLPLDKLQLEYGVIKNPITFVEELMQGGSMVLVRADTLDYMEMLHDKKDKDEAKKYSIKELIPGDRVISCLCKDGNVMVYMGKFSVASLSYKNEYGYYSRDRAMHMYISETPERAFFAYEMPNGEYKISDYPLTNKTVKEVYRCDDKGSERTSSPFLDEDKNLEYIRNEVYTSRYSSVKYDSETRASIASNSEIKFIDGWIRYAHIQKGKTEVRKNAIQYINDHENLIIQIYSGKTEPKSRIFESYEELQHYKHSRR